ncbi:GHKL domain-containing protein [Erysipelothrix sp. HDW6C]|uniref:sensor histidine kinase n=1 Tax=Erysipelothrix sp. HDW6C TaxID=2714930 RepID=UPI00140DD69A|nr:ATP-binding protein [Erysipelothrix sp. HDW6C]QIK70175.1 GHKL domain-containing protein [Erysipelothrix sp. HDW6C]
MLRKENSFQIVVFAFFSILALMVRNTATIVLLIACQIIIWIVNHYKQNDALHFAKKKAEIEKVEANVRADDAFDKLVKLINAIPSPLVYINQKGDFEVSNQYFDQLIEIESKDVYDVHIDSPIRQILLDAFLNEKQFVRQFNYKDIDFQVLSIPLVAEGNRYNGCMLIFQDVTRVVEGEKMQKRFIADASHELRTPITSIKGMIEILTREGFDDKETEVEFLGQIKKENNRLDKIVEDLLLQSKLRANQVYLEKTVFNLKQFFDGLVYERRQELHQANIEVVINCASNLEVQADQFRLSQVFLNLFNNAINYAENGKIQINCSTGNHKVTIEFIDDGTGVKPEILPHLFERFYRGQTSRARDSGGSGLGLAISKSIIEAHEGTISVTSKENEGTTFTIELNQE